MNDSQLKVVQKIWAFFLMSPALYALILHMTLSDDPTRSAISVPAWPFQTSAGLAAALAFLFWRGGLQRGNLRKAGSSAEAISARWVTTHFILYILAESVGIIGLAMGFLNRDLQLTYPILGVSALLIAVMYPRRATLESALSRNGA